MDLKRRRGGGGAGDVKTSTNAQNNEWSGECVDGQVGQGTLSIANEMIDPKETVSIAKTKTKGTSYLLSIIVE